MTKNILVTALVSLFVLTQSQAFAADKKRKPSSAERPPQFVLLAFDGSSSLDMWRDTVSFARTVPTKNVRGEDTTIKFSYFINPTYYTEKAYRDAYKTPILNTPYSCIGWAAPTGSVLQRVRLTDAAFIDGHEIGSHANSHCSADGSDESKMKGHSWTEEDWTNEFTQFNDLLFNALSINHIKTPSDFVMKLKKEDIVGFRAPALATTPGLWPTLKKFNFKYDTSRSASATYWPERLSWGGWNVPLASIKVAGSGKKTYSMDYNWFVMQTGGESMTTEAKCQSDPDFRNNKWCKAGLYLTDEKYLQLKNQMLDSYKYYFKNNYFGGRGPVQIGHHFSRWNGGAYWEAFKEFAQFVCSKPEVKCVTINEYVGWLNGLSAADLANYRAGQFPRLTNDNTIKDIADVFVPLAKMNLDKNIFKVVIQDNKEVMAKSMKLKKQLSIDYKPISSESLNLSDLKKYVEVGATALVRASLVNKKGEEVSWETYKVTNIGTPAQAVSEHSIEYGATQPETSDAHMIEQ